MEELIKITSRGNALFRQLKNLRRQNLIFVEGIRLCRDAAGAGLKIKMALLTGQALDLPEAASILEQIDLEVPRILLADDLFFSLADTRHPQGLAFVCEQPDLSIPLSAPAKNSLYLIADGLQDPGNLGTLIRSAEAFAFSAVIITGGTVYPFNDKVIRAAMGSLFRIKIIRFDDLHQAADWLRKGNISLLAADLAGIDITAAGLPVPAALIIGNEAHGLSREALDLADMRIKIPMPGNAESLNAAAAGSILCYEMLRSKMNRL